MTYQLVEHIELNSNQASVTFSNIPQDGFSLIVRMSVRSTNSDDDGIALNVTPNNSTSNDKRIRFLSNFGDALINSIGKLSNDNNTADIFGSIILEINNYASSGNHSYFSKGGYGDDSVSDSDMVFDGYGDMVTSSPINSLTFDFFDSSQFVSGSIISLYKIGA